MLYSGRRATMTVTEGNTPTVSIFDIPEPLVDHLFRHHLSLTDLACAACVSKTFRAWCEVSACWAARNPAWQPYPSKVFLFVVHRSCTALQTAQTASTVPTPFPSYPHPWAHTCTAAPPLL